MKLILVIISLTSISCNQLDFKVNDCIQKPDESVVWKIVELKGKESTLVQSAKNAPEIARTEKLNSSWIKAKCQD